ncbi:tRNA (adenosine(37)-N6)-dimethylallyltransferase MiaA [Candidatus Gottesmanbacteria bacterium RIFCSPHIGHO2_01_FULL_42_12]|uniref:tRNA dimethylallyltransferase n=1 Tax=Candidatus Gottesmanbacteria bacterium RIFCSPHIGHO2_01_FULL_42_12 TaxID=1798377 RepID=A0A1F5Z0Y5_9BACT|nr:MAG: tRNA (adenosine(37)-N6)-dimethylallyltransferase MiaA [Candidatus Gottesmanbacteria bacterium RIFCSPHIGHO2_01_FULL_42_12]
MTQKKMDKTIFIIGPTATGKTKLGVELAKKFNGEIISADSRQVYKYMDIGTGKDLLEYKDIKYWGIDLCDPDYDFNVSEFRKYAIKAIKDISGRGKVPIIVGGTGFYVRAILKPWETMDIRPDENLRERLESLSITKLQEELKEKDIKKWERMNESDRLNTRRLVRAIETVGKIASSQAPRNDTKNLIIGLTASYDLLYERIDKRVDQRIKNGMAEEKEKLKRFKKIPKTLGYGNESAKEWKFGEHAYARRQQSYFRNFGRSFNINWFDIYEENLLNKVVEMVGKYLA